MVNTLWEKTETERDGWTGEEGERERDGWRDMGVEGNEGESERGRRGGGERLREKFLMFREMKFQ